MNNNINMGAACVDATNILNSMLLYAIASKVMNKGEINIILEEGKEAILSTINNDDKILVDKIVTDVSANIKNAILSINFGNTEL